MRLEVLRERLHQELSELEGIVALRREGSGTVPHLFREEEELEELALWPKYSLAEVLKLIRKAHPEARLGIVCRGCDERHLVELAKHEQVDLDRIRVIGLACTPEEAVACECAEPYPSQIDVGERVEPAEMQRLREHRDRSVDERLEFWQGEFERCLKCYGCRNACAQCFCQDCVLEDELWVPTGEIPPTSLTFHLIRAMHTIGKCIDCGECEKACPAGIPLRTLYRLLAQDMEELFGYRPGRSMDESLPLLLEMEP
jgi:coenzyme F420-reducing hydrogenase beta subunit